jgi:hypothetical protein
VIAYFGINESVTYATNLEAAVEARAAFSADLVANYLSSFNLFRNWREGEGKSASDDDIYGWLEGHLPGNFSTSIPWVDTASLKVGHTAGGTFGGHSRPIFIVEVQEYKSPRPWTSAATVNFSEIGTQSSRPYETAKAAVRDGIEIRKDEDYATLYLRTENALIHKQVALPTSGFLFLRGRLFGSVLLLWSPCL